MARPGPKARAMPFRGLAAINLWSTNSTVADDMLPNSLNTARDAFRAFFGRLQPALCCIEHRPSARMDGPGLRLNVAFDCRLQLRIIQRLCQPTGDCTGQDAWQSQYRPPSR